MYRSVFLCFTKYYALKSFALINNLFFCFMSSPVIALISSLMKQFRLHVLYERCYANKGLIERIFCITNLAITLHLLS